MNIKRLWNFIALQKSADVPMAGRIYREAPFGRTVDVKPATVTPLFEVRVPIEAIRIGTEFVIELATERASALITPIFLVPRIGCEDVQRKLPLPAKGHVFPVKYRAVLTGRGLMVWLDEGAMFSRDYMLYDVPAVGELLISMGVIGDDSSGVQLMGVSVDMFT